MGEWGVGMPGAMLLDTWGRSIYEAFGEYPYLVGSATKTTQWRDVDVRLMLDDEHFDRVFGAGMPANQQSPLWSAICTAFAVWGRQVTGLPIDFQIQRVSEANALYGRGKGCIRMALGIHPLSLEQCADQAQRRAIQNADSDLPKAPNSQG